MFYDGHDMAISFGQFGQRQACCITFRKAPEEQWLRILLDRIDAHPTETERFDQLHKVVIYRDRFRPGFVELVKSSAAYATEIIDAGLSDVLHPQKELSL